MTQLAVVIDVREVEKASINLLRINATTLGTAAVRGVNIAAKKVYDESRSRMLARVNLTEQYVMDRMGVESSNDPGRPEAKIIAFRAGGRRPGLRPTNLRQYAAVQVTAPVRFNNNDPRIARNAWGQNPRKDGAFLKWKKRTGAPALGIPVGQKQAGVSVEVLRGQRKTITFAFMQRMPNGEMLVMARRASKRGPGHGKGKIESLHSLSVWQLFRKTSAQVIPFASETLASEVSREVSTELKKILA